RPRAEPRAAAYARGDSWTAQDTGSRRRRRATAAATTGPPPAATRACRRGPWPAPARSRPGGRSGSRCRRPGRRAPPGRDRRRAQRAREEGVEALVLERIGLLGLAHVRVEAVHEAPDECVLDERHAAARDQVREAREQMLRQQVLQGDEQPRPHAVGISRAHKSLIDTAPPGAGPPPAPAPPGAA